MRWTTDAGPRTGTDGTTRRSDEILSGHREDFVRQLYAEHGTLLLSFAARLLDGDWHRAEDVLQEAMVRAWKHASTLGMKVEEARPWLFTVVKNLVIDHHRARRIRPPENGSVELLDVPVQDAVDRLLTSHVVREAFDELREQHREIVRLMYVEERSVAQVAAQLGIPQGTVKSRSYYALRALRKALAGRNVIS
ncbi:sigma-70 family RNA polymerase sigma factor [Streptomyces lomondensis]|uniref:RNA polymerase sigma factor n=1 Tax=Streptomyces lomondensis TaxID=68229 RepID=A0ABQ2XU77_9ACTN|nr:sigma-70 family RNA polymerase sigma factor [Streptomyces lomondensis]MCF0082715.1 sigma-70 family RNA polymerase sigma factor [Streptomyces lomondensis]GGX32218.1 RNA polymerase sigma factor [Streptomyces lomondensis]